MICSNCGDPVCLANANPCDASWQHVADCERRAKEKALARVAELEVEVAGLRAKLTAVANLVSEYAPIMADDNMRVPSPYAHWHMFGRRINALLEEA